MFWKLDRNHRFSVEGQTTWAARHVGRLAGHNGAVDSLDFDPHGKTLVTLSDDGELRLWDVGTHRLIGAPLPGSNTYGSVRKAEACSIARRNLTPTEWTEFLGRRDYRTVCP